MAGIFGKCCHHLVSTLPCTCSKSLKSFLQRKQYIGHFFTCILHILLYYLAFLLVFFFFHLPACWVWQMWLVCPQSYYKSSFIVTRFSLCINWLFILTKAIRNNKECGSSCNFVRHVVCGAACLPLNGPSGELFSHIMALLWITYLDQAVQIDGCYIKKQISKQNKTKQKIP